MNTPPTPGLPQSFQEPKRGARLPIDVIATLILLLALVIGFAIYSSIQSSKIAEETETLNIANRQRMLSERQAKLLYRVGIGFAEKNPIDMAESVRELKKTHNIFGDTLKAFSQGGDTPANVEGKTFTISPVEGPDLRASIASLENIWRDYSEKIDQLLSTRLSKVTESIITKAADATREVNEPLLSLSTDFASALEKTTERRLRKLQLAQQIAAAGFILLLAFIAARVIKDLSSSGKTMAANLDDLSASNASLAAAQTELAQNSSDLKGAYDSLTNYSAQMEETSNLLRIRQEESETIFSAVNEGLFLIDSSYKIGSQVSDEMFEIFETDTLTDRSIIDLLRPLITERDLKSLEGYLQLQFDPRTSESQLEKYNPLAKTEVTLNWDGGGFSTKNLGFNFERVFSADNQVASVLVTVNDVTETVRLENELTRANETRDRQTALIFEIMEADPKELDIFLKKTESSLDDINDELEASSITEDTTSDQTNSKSLIESIFRKVHNIKGNSSLLGIQSVVDIASKVENKLGELRNRPTMKGDDLLTSIVELAYMRELLNEFEELRATTTNKFQANTGAAERKKLTKTQNLVHELQGLTTTIGVDYQKSASISAGNLTLESLPSDAFQHTRDLLIQLVRNSMVHGIEKPELRSERNKWVEGSIQIISSIVEADDSPLGVRSHMIGYRDDGGGIDAEKIAKRALELEIISEKEMKSMKNAEKSALIFDHRFTAIDVSDDHAGRGAGMGLIREKVNKDLKGKMRMVYETGEYLEFTFFIPAEAVVPA